MIAGEARAGERAADMFCPVAVATAVPVLLLLLPMLHDDLFQY